MAAGGDPTADRKAEAEEARHKRSATLGRLVEDYVRVLPLRPKLRGSGPATPAYRRAELAQVRLALEDMKAKDTPAADLAEAEVRRLLGTAGGVSVAWKRFGALSRFLDWCHDEGHVRLNPCTQIARHRRPKAPQARAHYLTPTELALLWTATESLREPVWRDLARFLIVVPCWRNEAARMDWSHVDLAAAEWCQPTHLTKNRDPHRVHLHCLARDVLKERQRAVAEAQADGDPAKFTRILSVGQPREGLVFPAPVSQRPVDTFADIKAEMIEATKDPPRNKGIGMA